VPVAPSTIAAHLLGTARMGNDVSTSVADWCHRAHDVPNLFLGDGSSLVTSGWGQPTMTIQALAFRAAEHIGAAARNGEIEARGFLRRGWTAVSAAARVPATTAPRLA
jgi:choline dehydrogenase-like flavoprotein